MWYQLDESFYGVGIECLLQTASANCSVEYVNAMQIDVLDELFTSDTEHELQTAVVDTYTGGITTASEHQIPVREAFIIESVAFDNAIGVMIIQ